METLNLSLHGEIGRVYLAIPGPVPIRGAIRNKFFAKHFVPGGEGPGGGEEGRMGRVGLVCLGAVLGATAVTNGCSLISIE